jgi:hypothetical protein
MYVGKNIGTATIHPDYPEALRPLDFMERADQFLLAFRQLPAGKLISWPRYLMMTQAIELVLKAYLSWRGIGKATLRYQYGHNIKKLMRDAVSRGLSITPLAQGELELLNEAHVDNWPRYPKEDARPPVFVIEQFEPYAEELFIAVSGCVRGGPHFAPGHKGTYLRG